LNFKLYKIQYLFYFLNKLYSMSVENLEKLFQMEGGAKKRNSKKGSKGSKGSKKGSKKAQRGGKKASKKGSKNGSKKGSKKY